VFLANDYTSSEAGERADVFRVKVPENDLRVDSGYTPFGQNLYIERTVKPEELEHIGHYPVGGGNLHSGMGAKCKDCDLAQKERQEDQQKREKEKEEKYSTPVLIYELKFESGKLAEKHVVHYKSGADKFHEDHSIEDCPETAKNPGVVVRPKGIEDGETVDGIVEAAGSAPEQSVSTAIVLDDLVKDGIVNLDAAPDSTILSNFTKNDIPLEQKNALFYYLGPQYRSFNNFLRFGDEDSSDKVPEIEQRIKDLDALIESRGSVEAESFVYRGMIELPKFEDTDITMSEMLDGLKPGDIISDPAFLSTSSDKNIALRKFGPGIMTDNGPTLDASNPVYEPSSFWAIRVPEGSKALAAPEDSYFSEKEVILPRNTQLRIDGIKKVAQEEEGGENGNFNYFIEASVVPVGDGPGVLDDWDPVTGLETSAENKTGIEPGFENWVGKINELFESIDKLEEEGFIRGNATHAVFLEAAGFNGKPQVLSQAEFDALEGTTIYRGLESADMITDYQESLVQYAGEGTFGNGTYGSNLISTGIRYAAKSGGNEGTGALRKRVMEMKLLPDANVMVIGKDDSFSNKKMIMSNNFMDAYEKSGASREQYDDAEYKLYNDADWTNIAIMNGFDAIQFDVPFSGNDEKYTIILNRGKVAINGKS
jgi:hypothetical protein